MTGADRPDPGAGDAGRYVNDARYARLVALWQQARGEELAGTQPAQGAILQLLYREARLLDEQRYDDWLGQYTADCIVWVPAQAQPTDPRKATGIYLDDRRRMGDRIGMVRTGHLHAQTPPSRTRRMLSNAEQWVDPATGCTLARANLVIWEHRKGQTRAWPAWQVYELAQDATGRWLIASRILCLLDRDAPQGNYAFIL